MPGDKHAKLETLRQQITAIAAQPALRDTAHKVVGGGLLATPRGVLHEVYADTPRDGGAALGFALAQAGLLIEAGRPAVLYVQMSADAQELGLPYGLGLDLFGLDARQLVLIRTAGIAELLWAIEEAIACRAVAAIVADIAHPHKALDFTASRRLSLRAAAAGASVLMVRYARDREASAARYRWRISPVQSRPPPFDDRAPGLPRWQVTLEKGSLDGQHIVSPEGEALVVDWTRHGFARVAADDRTGGARRTAALSGAVPAALGDGLSQAS